MVVIESWQLKDHILNWSFISKWLTLCHNPQEGPWAPWSNIYYPSSTMSALGSPSQMEPSASPICTYSGHYSKSKVNSYLHLLPCKSFVMSKCPLCSVFIQRRSCTIIPSLCVVTLSQPLNPIIFLHSGICVRTFMKQIPRARLYCTHCVTESVCVCVWLNVFQQLNKDWDCIASQLINQLSPLYHSARLHVNVCVSIY